MCGIAGIYNTGEAPPPKEQELQAMGAKLRHRGPDGLGFYRDDDVGFAHARLSIIDLATGDQPIHNEDKTVWVILNGEIFNYIELRRELEHQGHRFYTQSDTEVLVHLYEEHGDNFVDHLNGQFGIALWDTRRKALLLVRDRPGIVPLFIAETGNRLLFASEVKALLPMLGEAPRLNLQSLDQLMTFWAPVSPNTVFEGIFEIPPGEMRIVRGKKIEARRYWDWPFPTDGVYREGSESDLAEELHELLVDATTIRLRSDVPVGAYLSGGLDSSVITSMIHHHGNVPLRTFSIGFEDKDLDETSHQQKMIDHLNADHSRIHCGPRDIADNFLRTIWHTESPVLRTAPVPMGILSGLVHDQNYRVVLTGEGADEVLGGYDIFKEAKIRQFWARHPKSKLRPLLLKRLYPYLSMTQGQSQGYLSNFFGQGIETPDLSYFSHIPRFRTTAKSKDFLLAEIKAALTGDIEPSIETLLPKSFASWHPFNRSQYMEIKSLMSGYLLNSQGDRMLLSNSVEGRFPFLDHRVMEFACRIHPRLKMKVLDEKYLLKKAAGHYLPSDIVKRHKQPYRAPDIPAFIGGDTQTTPDYVQELLSEEMITRYGYFDPNRVRLLNKKARAGRAVGYKDNMAFIGILSTQIWHYHFIENFQSNFSY
ncbi:MAG: asparagine synthase (glutamine-hydrolyzing) [Deltaproteobacteria bacterium]|nr:asparagine synthase (glutamine-hydrolyzing) [Deltaproteobacteria bacterium]